MAFVVGQILNGLREKKGGLLQSAVSVIVKAVRMVCLEVRDYTERTQLQANASIRLTPSLIL